MLLFRSEEHVDRWCQTWSVARGEVLSLEAACLLATAWYSADRRAPDWLRRTPQEAEALFAGLGLRSPFWRFAPPSGI